MNNKKKETIAQHLKNEAAYGRTFSVVFVCHQNRLHKFVGKEVRALADGAFFMSIAKVKTYIEAGNTSICFIAE